jgi:4-diphosphocytidyl-2-C-methyl-D-erythritol kinase
MRDWSRPAKADKSAVQTELLSTLTLTIPAFAKVNLNLRVLGRRDDGYHDLDTVFQTVSLHDTIEFSLIQQPHIVLSSNDRSLPVDESNLVMRAAKALQARFRADRGARIRLQKRIPTQAGLGGGSSDAAATLLVLAKLWELNCSWDELLTIAAQLGADVPFFFYGGTVKASGIGEQLETLEDIAQKFLLIVKPNANISTADAYRALDERSLTSPIPETILSTSQQTAESDKIDLANLTNDFEAVVFDLETEIRRAKSALLKAGANAALLAGSGSAVFGIFDSEDAQRRAIQAIELETGWRVFPCKTVGREEYKTAFGDLRLFS